MSPEPPKDQRSLNRPDFASNIGLWDTDDWRRALGSFEINIELATRLQKIAAEDDAAYARTRLKFLGLDPGRATGPVGRGTMIYAGPDGR